MKRTVILIDSKNALFRFGSVHRYLKHGDRHTGAIYGILGLLLRLKEKYPDAFFVMVWEGKGKSWRHEFWDGYKANRKKGDTVPEEIQAILAQVEDVTKIGEMLGIPQLSVPTLEADDLIGLLARRLTKAQYNVIVYSSDMDFLQLMKYGVKLIRDVDKTVKLRPESEASVRERFGCTVDQLLMVRSLAGDKSDGIPGAVPGVGAKTAAKYVQAGAYPDKVVEAWPTVCRNLELMRIVTRLKSCRLTEDAFRGAYYAIKQLEQRLACPQEFSLYNTLVEALAERGLVQALEKRAELLRIQSP